MDVRSTPTASITVLSDDVSLTSAVTSIVGDENTHVCHQPTQPGPVARDDWHDDRPDIVIVDRRTVADLDRRIRHFRRRWPTIEIVVVNVSDEHDAELALDCGADDAVIIGSPLLAARLHARARRARTVNAGSRIALGDIVVDRESRRVWCAGKKVEMTPREFAMLDCLFWHAPKPVSVATLADFVWGDAEETDRRGAVEVYIGYVRRKLSASRDVVLRTVRQVGYQFDRRR